MNYNTKIGCVKHLVKTCKTRIRIIDNPLCTVDGGLCGREVAFVDWSKWSACLLIASMTFAFFGGGDFLALDYNLSSGL